MTKPSLDLTQTHFTRPCGDITIHGSWYGDELRPCLVIVPTYGRRGYYKPSVILVDDAYLWSTEFGSVGYVMQQAPKIVAYLGFDLSAQLCARVANLVQDHMADLLQIPPKPVELFVVADAIATDENGRQRHTEILDHA